MVYVKVANAVFAGSELKLDKNVYLLDGNHVIEVACVEGIHDRIVDAIDELIIVGTDLEGRTLPPAMREPVMLENLIANRASGKYNLPYKIYGAIWVHGPHDEPILKPVCEFPTDDGAERML